MRVRVWLRVEGGTGSRGGVGGRGGPVDVGRGQVAVRSAGSGGGIP